MWLSPRSLALLRSPCENCPPAKHIPHRRLQQEDPFAVNEVFTAVWNCMGLYPLIYAAILIPAARNDGKVCAPGAPSSLLTGHPACCVLCHHRAHNPRLTATPANTPAHQR